MYQFLRGIITEKITEPVGLEKLILDVNGIGFELHMTQTSLDLIGKKGEIATVYTTLIHKEDGMTLYGFVTLMEKEIFNLLCSVSGVGPKTALCLLNGLTVSEITYSILNEDATILCKANGIGEKTASRIILELKEKIKNWVYLPIAYSRGRTQGLEAGVENQNNLTLNEARSVLQSLGYSTSEISQAFTQAKANGNCKDPESLTHFSLKWLSAAKR